MRTIYQYLAKESSGNQA